MNFDSLLALYAKINSKWVIDLNIKYKTIKHNIGENLDDLAFDRTF